MLSPMGQWEQHPANTLDGVHRDLACPLALPLKIWGFSINGGTPIAGWFIMGKSPSRNGWFFWGYPWRNGKLRLILNNDLHQNPTWLAGKELLRMMNASPSCKPRDFLALHSKSVWFRMISSACSSTIQLHNPWYPLVTMKNHHLECVNQL